MDPVTDLPRPDGRRPTAALAHRTREWIDWFGIGRLLTAAVSIVAVVAGGVWLLRSPPPPTETGLSFAGASTTANAMVGSPAVSPPPASAAPSPVTVHVAGAVVTPGVYALPPGARVHAAIEAAGGPTPKGDPGALNLAAALTDGERVYVPKVGETVALPPAATSVTGSAAPAGPIDLNRATAVELDTLPGIGPSTAQAIIDHRDSNGPFASVDDLEAVRGIGPAKLDAIRDLVRV